MQIDFYNESIERFIHSLEKDIQAKILDLFAYLSNCGHEIRMPHSKSLGRGLYELRITSSQQVRFIYMFRKNQIILILTGFIKKQRKIPHSELRLARKRKKTLDEYNI